MMRLTERQRLLLLTLLVMICSTNVDTKWRNQASLGIVGWRSRAGVELASASHPACSQSDLSLSQNQRRICQLYPDHMASVVTGVRVATDECRFQLQWRRWNCTSAPGNRSFAGYSVARSGSREAAFVHASLAAGIVFSVSRACRDGRIAACGCSRRQPGDNQVRWGKTAAAAAAERPGDTSRALAVGSASGHRGGNGVEENWVWGGCSDNTDYGYKFATSFVDAREREKNYPRHSTALKHMLMNLHNNEAGRLAVNNYVTVACKCHGVSGSCALRTCWHQLPDFRAVGDRLLSRYDSALRGSFNRHGTSLVRRLDAAAAGGTQPKRRRRRRRQRQRRRDSSGRRAAKEQLLFVDESPDNCRSTTGRRCLRQTEGGVRAGGGRLGQADCEKLCCGRGYNEFRRTTTVRCRCKFIWCCQVACDVCRRTENILVCK